MRNVIYRTGMPKIAMGRRKEALEEQPKAVEHMGGLLSISKTTLADKADELLNVDFKKMRQVPKNNIKFLF